MEGLGEKTRSLCSAVAIITQAWLEDLSDGQGKIAAIDQIIDTALEFEIAHADTNWEDVEWEECINTFCDEKFRSVERTTGGVFEAMLRASSTMYVNTASYSYTTAPDDLPSLDEF